MFYIDFALIYTNGFKSLLCTCSALFIPKSNTKKSMSLYKNSTTFFAELCGVPSAL